MGGVCRAPDVHSLSSEALVAACSRGNSAALGTLFVRFAEPVRRFLWRYVGAGNPDCEDLVQVTFLEVLRAAPRFRNRSAVQTWIIGIALNTARHYQRREARRLLRMRMGDARRRPLADRGDPEASALRHELAAGLTAALASLPDELRTIFMMCELQELPGAVVARHLHLGEGALRRRLQTAYRLLRGAMEAQHGAGFSS